MSTLCTEELEKSYGGRCVVDDVSLHVSRGEVVGLLGPNGAGKTTTFHIIVGLASPDSGRVLLNGQEITAFPMYQRARHGISYLPQEPSVFRKLSVQENLLAILETLTISWHERRERLETLLDQFGLQTVRKNRGDTLSGGERRRVEIARALVISPSFILLDEPFSGIDPLAVLEIQRIIGDLKRSGIGILVTDHNVRETLTVTDRAYIINNGRIFRNGTPEALSNDPEVKRVYLGEGFSFAGRSASSLEAEQEAAPLPGDGKRPAAANSEATPARRI
jgi:lipopolysaccharide export system ATP-binding protein